MGDAYKGLTIRIGADTRKLNSALNSVKASTREVQGSISHLTKALNSLDTQHVRAMSARIEAMGDKTRLAARSVALLETGFKQAANQKVKFKGMETTLFKMRKSMSDVFTETQRTRSAYNGLDTQLQHVYDSLGRIAAQRALKQELRDCYKESHKLKAELEAATDPKDVKKLTSQFDQLQDKIEKLEHAEITDRMVEKAAKDVKKLAKELDGTGKEAEEAEKKIRSLAMSLKGGEMLEGTDQGHNIKNAHKTIDVIKALRAEQKAYNQDLEALKTLQGFKTIEYEAAAADAEVRRLALETARFKSELFAIGSSKAMADAVGQVKTIDHALDAATSSAQKMRGAYASMPNSFRAMLNQMRALQSEETTLAEKTKSLNAAIKTLENVSGLKSMAIDTKDVYVQFAKAEDNVAKFGAKISKAEESLAILKGKLDNTTTLDATGLDKGKLEQKIERVKDALDRVKSEAVEADAALEKAAQAKKIVELNTELAETEGRMSSVGNEMRELIASVHEWKFAVKEIEGVVGFQKLEHQVANAKNELRKAATESTNLKAELHAIGADGLAKASSRADRLGEAVEQAADAARKMSSAYSGTPRSIEAAISKARALKNEEETLKAQLEAYKNVMREIEASSSFDKQAAMAKDVYVQLAKAKSEVQEYDEAIERLGNQANEAKAELLKMIAKEGETARGTAEFKKQERILADTNSELVEMRARAQEADAALDRASKAARWRETKTAIHGVEAELARVADLSTHTNMFGDIARSMRTAGYGIYSTLTPAIMMAGRYAVQAAEDVDAAYRDMRKTVNGTEEQFEHLKDAAIDFSRTHVTSADTILEIEAMGGQLGISVDNLEEFARTVSNLDIATNMEADDISEQLGKMASVMDINVDEYSKFGDALVRLGNNMPVMEGDIMNMTTRYMGMGKVVGMTADEMLAWSAASIATGQRAEAAGSAMQRFISRVETAVTKGGDSLDGFAKVAGMSSSEFQKAFKTDASSALYAFIEGLGKLQKDGESVNQTLSDLKFGNVRDKQLLEGLAQQMANGTEEANLLKNSLQMSSDAYKGLATTMSDGSVEEAGDAMREAEKKSEGFSGELGKLKNNAIAAALELGDGLIPIMKMGSAIFQDVTKWLSELPDEMKTTVSGLALAAAATGPLMVGLGSVGSAVSEVIKHVRKFPSAWAKIAVSEKIANGIATAFGNVGSATRFMVGDAGNAARKIDNMGEKMALAARSASLLKMAAGGLALGALAVGVSVAIDEYQKYQEHCAKVAKVSEDMYTRMANAAKNAGDAVQAANGSMVPIVDWRDIAEQYEGFINEVSDSYDSLQQKANETFSNNALISNYADQIREILELMDENPDGILTPGEQARLTAAVENYNKAAGDSIEITNAEKGVLKDAKGEVIETADAFEKLAEKKKYAALAEYYSEEYATAFKAQKDAAQQLATAEKELQTIQEERKHLDPSDPYLDTKIAHLDKAEQETQDTIENLKKQTGELQSNANQAQEALEAMTRAQSDSSTAIDGMIASSPEIMAALHSNYESATQFADALNSMGEQAQKLSPEQVTQLAQSWDGSMASIMPILDQYGLKLQAMNELKIANKTFYVTDEGTIYDAEGNVKAFEKITIGKKTYYVDDKGTVSSNKKQLNNLKSIKIGGKTYIVSDNGTIEGESAKLQGIKSMTIGNKHYYVTDDGSIYDEQGKLGQLNDTQLSNKFVTTDDRGTSDAVKKKILDLTGTLKAVPSSKTTTMYANTDSAEKNLSAMQWSIDHTTGKTIYMDVITRYSTQGTKPKASDGPQTATGGISSSGIALNARGGLIPAHASGAINGIVNHATLTSIGWVGEDGSEAVFHMGHAGGAVIPLSNRRYVRPFARAVAGEMGGGGSSSVVNNINVSLTYDSTAEARQMARDITDEINSLLAMGA